jgi:hypothetical protein
MGRRAILIGLALAAVVSFGLGLRSWRWQREHGWGPPWSGEQRRLDALAEACVRAAERSRSSP